MNTDARLIYITTETPQEAHTIARALVEERLAACANILAPVTSIFRWDGDIREGDETVLLAKTTSERVDALTERVINLHSYDCPCIAAFPIEGGNTSFLEWVVEEVDL
ncbi:MAG: divalent-cation tolerance protein CutA [Pseudomonadota bacterium]|nr:divalent-cation tolerance protein CutA [Pseudomonadota bacterium]